MKTGSSPKTAEQIKAAILSYNAYLKSHSDLNTKINSLEISLRGKINAITDWEKRLTTLENDTPKPELQQTEPTSEQLKIFDAQLVLWEEEIRKKREALQGKIKSLGNEKNKLNKELKAEKQLLNTLINNHNEADGSLAQRITLLEKFFASLYQDATIKDKELSELLKKASTTFQVGLGLAGVSLTAAFIPAVLAIATAIIVGSIPCAIVLAIAFFVL